MLSCDTFVDDVTILTPGEDKKSSYSIAIQGKEILAVGPRHHFSEVNAVCKINGGGAICLPGLVNTHNHTPLMSVRGMVEDLGFAPAYVPGVPQGHWLGDEETFLLARLGLAELMMQGSTCVVDFYARPKPLAEAMKQSGLRGFVGGRIMDVDTASLAEGRFILDPELGEKTLEDSVALIEKWSECASHRVSCVLGPHAVDTCSPPLLRRVADIANKRGLLVHSHLAQSKLEIQRIAHLYGKRGVEILDEVGLLNDHLIVAHCIYLDKSEINRIASSGSSVAHVPLGNATSGQIAPIMAMHTGGVRITLATDTKSGDMFETMRNVIRLARIKSDGEFVLDAQTVFEWATVGGASALGLGDCLGKIKPGFKADLIILDRKAPNLRPVVDGFGILVYSAMGLNVKTVICDGEILLNDGVPTTFDIEEVIYEAQKVTNRLWERARG